MIQDIINSLNYFIYNTETYLLIFFIIVIFAIHKLVVLKKIKLINLFTYYFLVSFFIIFIFYLFPSSIANLFNIDNQRILKDSIFFYGDTFADGLKVLYSYIHVFNPEQINFYSNIYNGNPFLKTIPDSNVMFNIHTVPLVTIFFHITAHLINIFNISHPYFIVVNFFIYLMLVLRNFNLIKSVSSTYGNIFITLSVFSYPVLFLYQRGNFTAGYTSQLLIMSYILLFKKKKMDIKILALLIIALSLRPNYIFLLPIYFIDSNLKTQINEIIKIFFVFVCSNFIFLRLAMLFYEDYSLSGMLVGFRHIRDSHIFIGDGFDSSLFRVIQRLFDPNNLHTYPWYNTTLFAGALLVIYIFFNRKMNVQLKAFLLTMFSLVISFPIADYHLPVLILIILLILLKNKKTKIDHFLIILILIILLPIPHFIKGPPSFSNFLNIAIFLYTFLISLNRKFYKSLLSQVND